MNRTLQYIAVALFLSLGCLGTPAVAAPGSDRDELVQQYRTWLDQGRTPARIVQFVKDHSPGWTSIDHLNASPSRLSPGQRLIFTDRDRTALLVVVGQRPLQTAGMRMIAAHIDTPTPRLDLTGVRSGDKPVLTASASAYGGIRFHHWAHTPLALVGRVAVSGEREIPVTLGLDEGDDFAFYATRADSKRRTLTVVLASIPPAKKSGSKQAKEPPPPASAQDASEPRDARLLFSELERRHGVERRDLATAELYLVPRQRAREVGVDRSLIGAHGQDDRINSYLAWRAALDLPGTPDTTVVAWLVDREEVGSYHVAGATSQFLEAVVAYLLRAQDTPATERNLARTFANTTAISADTPAMLNPNWPEVHEASHAPIIGQGAVLFAFTGGGGKDGGNQAHAPLVRQVSDAFQRAGQPLQYGLLGRVDEGGGGTIAKHLANRGMDVIDVGVAGISLHSPMELFAKDDLLSAYRGFSAWLAGK